MKYKILEVHYMPGDKYESGWRGDMQEITTDKGVFIDNRPEITHGGGHRSWKGNYWKQEIGNEVEAVEDHIYGHKALRYTGPKVALDYLAEIQEKKDKKWK